MNRTQFRQHGGFREELRKFLETEAGKAALKIVEDATRSFVLPSPVPGVPLDTLMAHQLNKNWGIQRAVALLRELTEPIKDTDHLVDDEIEEQMPFFHGLPEEMKNAIRKKFTNQ